MSEDERDVPVAPVPEFENLNLQEVKHDVSNEELKNIFLFNGIYGQNPEEWPHKTIIVGVLYLNDEEESRGVTRNEVNRGHAEEVFLNDLGTEFETKILNAGDRNIKVKIFLSYSPCSTPGHECAEKLNEWIRKLRKIKSEISVTIKFSNFYLHFLPNNEAGLRSLHENDITLETFYGSDEWNTFFNILEKSQEEINELQRFVNAREAREEEDARILRDFITSWNPNN